MKHLSHEHELVLQKADNGSHICNDCGEPISGPFYLCEEECRYYLHKVCAELPTDINHPINQNCTTPPATINCSDHDHQLTLLSNQFHEKEGRVCNICYEDMTTYENMYSCVECLFFAHEICATSSKIQPSSLGIEMKHFSHKHRLVLKKDNHGSHKCYGCGEPILGRYYRCKKGCGYCLHKVCAELPKTMNYPMHPQHPLTLLAESPYKSGRFVCDMCRMLHTKKFVYNCSICSFDLDMNCAIASQTIEDKCHKHPLTPMLLPSSFLCNICCTEEKSVSYKCSVCPFWVHQKCTLLPGTVKYSDHDHQLTLLPSIPNQFHKKLNFKCIICEQIMTTYETVYACIGCLFFAHASCATSSKIQPSSTSSLKIEMNHFSHEHLLLLKKSEELKTNRNCYGCPEQISGPFYVCKEGCGYRLHKVCAELPKTMNHPMHPLHPLTLLATRNNFRCSMCMEIQNVYDHKFVYGCKMCSFDLDMSCAIASHTVKDKCHMHLLIPIQAPISFMCYICRKKEKGDSYKCGDCPFWVHQNCTLLPATVKCSDHDHELTLLPSVPNEFHEILKSTFFCDICHDKMTAYETVFSCVGCLFFAHASCAISSRDENNGIDLKTKLLPMRKDWTSHISLIVRNDEEEENICKKCEQLISDCKCRSKLPEQILNSNKILDCEINHFSHEHMLHLLDNDEVCGKVCEACAELISDPSYGCTQCDYFLHKCCIDLPEHIIHPFHSEHEMKLFAHYPTTLGTFRCSCCRKKCNTFGYKCDYKKCDFKIDLKCASLSGRIKHESHKHTLSVNTVVTNVTDYCSTCKYTNKRLGLKCEACRLTLCLFCAMLPAIVSHRYCKCEGFKLRYSPLQDYHTDYYCDLCENTLQPKHWFYHCGNCDQFAHTNCLSNGAEDSNIKFGKSYSLPVHEHVLILTRFTHEYSNCKICVTSLNKGFAVGFQCATCPYFKIHLECVKSWKELW